VRFLQIPNSFFIFDFLGTDRFKAAHIAVGRRASSFSEQIGL